MCKYIANCNRFLHPNFKTSCTKVNNMDLFPTIDTILMWFTTIWVLDMLMVQLEFANQCNSTMIAQLHWGDALRHTRLKPYKVA